MRTESEVPEDGRMQLRCPVCPGVEAETREQLLGGCPTPDPVALLEDEDTLTRASEVGGGHQSVVSRTDHNGIEREAHRAPPFRISRAASRPGPPQIPPPGCAPDPHR